MTSKNKQEYPTEITDKQLRYLITAFENNMAEFYPVGREAEIARQLLSLREQLAELKASIGFNVGDRVCDSVDKLGYGYVVSINNGRSEYPISVQFDKSDKGRISTYTADGRKLSGCPVCLYKTPSVTAANPAED
ncbi:hypothetical protein AB8896_06305 [Yersinia enterocolitica]|uniref:hypothetical protein n=1 Tax=Yersinia enterocolitica TaxID=630 RepID=UPI003D060CAC